MAKPPPNNPPNNQHRNNPPNNQHRNNPPNNQHNNPPRNNAQSQHFFHNPYTFVPTPARNNISGFAGDFDPIEADLVHNKRQDDLWTGELPVELTVITPLLLIDPNSEKKEGHHSTYDMMKHFESSSIRGVLRSAYETITNSRFGNFRNHQDRLGYRMPTDKAAKLVPAQIQGDEIRLFLGTSRPSQNGSPQQNTPMYAAMLSLYYQSRNDPRMTVCDQGYDPKTGDEVWAEVVLCQHQKNKNGQWSNTFQFWKVTKVWSKDQHPQQPKPTTLTPWDSVPAAHKKTHYSPIPTNGSPQRRMVEGIVYRSNENIGNKHDERVFFEDKQVHTQEKRASLTKELRESWRMRIQSYWDAHEDKDIFERRGRNGQTSPWEKMGREPGQTAWSPHQYHGRKRQQKDRWDRETQDARKLHDKDLVYAECQFDNQGNLKEIFNLYPVMISRELYDASPEELLDETLRPAKSQKELSPADRLFGWVAENKPKEGAAAYRGRLRVIAGSPPTHPNGNHIEQIRGGALPLAILGTPKPTQARFYVGTKEGKPLGKGLSKVQAIDITSHRLRGRKHFWHHRYLEAWQNGESTMAGKSYWEATSEDRTQTQQDVNEGNKRFQEYRKPAGAQERTDQNRSIKAWIRPGTTYTFSLAVENLQDEELGALLWLLSLPEDHYLRMGYGKPLGFGSIRFSLKNPEDSSIARGKTWRTYYASLEASPPCGLSQEERDTCINAFQNAMCQGYAPKKQKDDLGSFEKLPLIESFLQICQGPKKDAPIHYPRVACNEDYPPPHQEGKNFEWFVKNEAGRVPEGYSLPAPTEERALPIFVSEDNGSPRRGGSSPRSGGSGHHGGESGNRPQQGGGGGGNRPQQGSGGGGSPRPQQGGEKKGSTTTSDPSKSLTTNPFGSLAHKLPAAKGNPSPPAKPKK